MIFMRQPPRAASKIAAFASNCQLLRRTWQTSVALSFRKRVSILISLSGFALLFVPNPVTGIEEPIFQQIERDWHNDIVIMLRDRLPKVAIMLLLLFILQRVVSFLVARMDRLATNSSPISRGAQLRTMATLIRGTAYSILGFAGFLQFLKLFNYNPAPILASAGILGVGIGLGAQSLCKDIINGVFIFVEDQYNVGETVKIASLTGTVEDLTLRLTRLRDGDGTLYIIPNSQVATVSNLSRDFAVATLSISIDASADPTRVLALLRQVADQVRSETSFKAGLMSDPGVTGIDNINGRALVYSISAKVRIADKDDILRAFRNRIIDTFKTRRNPPWHRSRQHAASATTEGHRPDRATRTATPHLCVRPPSDPWDPNRRRTCKLFLSFPRRLFESTHCSMGPDSCQSGARRLHRLSCQASDRRRAHLGEPDRRPVCRRIESFERAGERGGRAGHRVAFDSTVGRQEVRTS